jgi:hypothetical protein
VIVDAVVKFATGMVVDAVVATGLFVVKLLFSDVVIELCVVQVLFASEEVVRVGLVIKYSAGPYWHQKEEMPQLPWPRSTVVVIKAFVIVGALRPRGFVWLNAAEIHDS